VSNENPEPVALNIVFDGPPGPNGAVFMEVEHDNGKSVRLGTWGQRPDGLWALRFTETEMVAAVESAR
jgi:hypothetical protein